MNAKFLGHIPGPPFGGVEGDDPQRSLYSPRNHVMDDRSEIGFSEVRFSERAAQVAEILNDDVGCCHSQAAEGARYAAPERLTAAFWHSRPAKRADISRRCPFVLPSVSLPASHPRLQGAYRTWLGHDGYRLQAAATATASVSLPRAATTRASAIRRSRAKRPLCGARRLRSMNRPWCAVRMASPCSVICIAAAPSARPCCTPSTSWSLMARIFGTCRWATARSGWQGCLAGGGSASSSASITRGRRLALHARVPHGPREHRLFRFEKFRDYRPSARTDRKVHLDLSGPNERPWRSRKISLSSTRFLVAAVRGCQQPSFEAHRPQFAAPGRGPKA
jgi:hypothetical protein